MAISQTQAILNFINTLDSFFASMRFRVDNQDPDSVIQRLNMIKSQMFGNSIDVFDHGIIFGVTACQIKNLGETWGIGYGPVGPDTSLFENENINDWVITRGNLFDGSKIINIEPPDTKLYVYKVSPHITDAMQNYLVPGVVLYSVNTHVFSTALMGQQNNNYPIIGVEKTGIDKESFINSALDYKYFNYHFKIARGVNDIVICRFIVDIDSIDNYTSQNQ